MRDINQQNFRRIIIVAYRLPFKLVKKKDEHYLVQNSGGLVSAILSLSEKINGKDGPMTKILWVGTGDKNLAKYSGLSEFELYPLEIPDKVSDKYYGGFCNDTIWPLFHYFPFRTAYDSSFYDAYLKANNLFFRLLKDLIKPGDFIWIHDYQLFTLPGIIRHFFPTADIGFFLHIPFPSFELFRLLPRTWRESILNGILGADVIGFHTNDYTQHFIKSVKRTLGHKIERNLIYIEDRICKADAFPIGIDYDKFHKACSSKKTHRYKNRLKSYLSGNKLIFSVDRLDYTKGFLQRLLSYERFLEKYPEWHYKVVFNMVVVPSRYNIEAYRELRKEIEATVGRINGKYSTLNWRPLVYQYKSVPFNELVAIYNSSDLALITPIRDGMNLVAKEYVACQEDKKGMLILSELAGAAVELNEAILINPADIEETSDAINKGLSMSISEKEARIMKMQSRLKRYNVFTWATDFFTQVNEVKKEQMYMKVKFIDKNVLTDIHNKYYQSSKRLFLFDYDGTLTPLAKLPQLAVLNDTTLGLLRNIASDVRNRLVIISGRDKKFIEGQVNGLNAIIVAEHGYFIKYPESDWTSNYNIDLSWKEKIIPVLNDYVDRCNGSAIEEKNASVAWHYRNADEEIASLRINELKDDLGEILNNDPRLYILEGDKVLEIKSVLYDKGTAASMLIGRDNYDFILALGDDNTDEDIFKILPDYGFSIKVGNRPTAAKYNLRNQGQIIDILKLLASSSGPASEQDKL
jgi:trehalose 6-phosphate synthase/phosphatase